MAEARYDFLEKGTIPLTFAGEGEGVPDLRTIPGVGLREEGCKLTDCWKLPGNCTASGELAGSCKTSTGVAARGTYLSAGSGAYLSSISGCRGGLLSLSFVLYWQQQTLDLQGQFSECYWLSVHTVCPVVDGRKINERMNIHERNPAAASPIAWKGGLRFWASDVWDPWPE